METMVERACGLDVHKESVVACVRVVRGNGRGAAREVRTFTTTLRGLKELVDWLKERAVQAIAMEGTGVYWRPVYAMLEALSTWSLIVGNAQHIKNVPGRKTDVKDAEWLADLVAHGLIRPSFVPPPWQRELRDAVRMRAAHVRDRTSSRNRALKVLQLGGVKLDGVASDAFGKSGMAMLRALAAGTSTPAQMAELACGRMRKKVDALAIALESPLSATHQRMLSIALEGLEATERQLAAYDALIDTILAPYAQQMALLQTIPGVERLAAAAILAELGPDMSAFATSAHAAAWAGLCPGNHKSAGKRSKGTTTQGNRYLKTALCQAAHAASHCKKGYFRDKFFRLKARRGHGRAVMAIAHKILVAAYNILQKLTPYRDLGEGYLDRRNVPRTLASLLARVQALGFSVVATPRVPLPEPS
jgi:transposase